MSAMEGLFHLRSENTLIGGNNAKIENFSSGSAPRKKLSDISNLPQRPKVSIQDEKLLFISATTKDYMDQLQKLSGIEFEKLRVNLQKAEQHLLKEQQQNVQLAQLNSQMLMELNISKDRLKLIQHELGCKNALLKAKRFISEVEVTGKPSEAGLAPSTSKQVQDKEKAENKRLCVRRQSASFKSEELNPAKDFFEPDDANVLEKAEIKPCESNVREVEVTGESSEVEISNKQPCTTNKRQQSKSLVPFTSKQDGAKEKAENRRLCARRQSVRLSGKLNPAGALSETNEAKRRDETKTGQNYGQEVEVTKHADTEEPLETGLGPSVVEQIQDRDQAEEYVRPKTRQNLDDEVEVTKHDESREPSEIGIHDGYLYEINTIGISQGLGLSAVTGIQEKQTKGKRRQSARFMSEGPKPTEDSFETDDTKFPLWPLHDDQVQEDSLTSTSACFEDQHNSVPCYQSAESRRFSFGRPLRQASKKVQTYKEIPVNLKMRRDK
ncbi:hypothetical protein RJ639_004821 [Escallonia herrerae]|uniref:Shugoshin C-terminal domain-containing protein n=1 Tax=Escallonia herrerae TaxID=1293975 RepID=A0AA88W070_9ASTE|nr:hypothetical protein RJ639_004821 [Escallonia herrerae]